jgi:hypothetical protein
MEQLAAHDHLKFPLSLRYLRNEEQTGLHVLRIRPFIETSGSFCVAKDILMKKIAAAFDQLKRYTFC